MGDYQFGTGGFRGSDELDRAIVAVRELAALLLEARELACQKTRGDAEQERLVRLVQRCAALEQRTRAEGAPLIDREIGDWVERVVEKHKRRRGPEVDKEGILRLANLVAKWRHKGLDNRSPARRDLGGDNRPKADIVPPVPLSVVPRIRTLEAALRISEKVKRQLLFNERVAAIAQTAKLAPSALRLLDIDEHVDFE